MTPKDRRKVRGFRNSGDRRIVELGGYGEVEIELLGVVCKEKDGRVLSACFRTEDEKVKGVLVRHGVDGNIQATIYGRGSDWESELSEYMMGCYGLKFKKVRRGREV